MSDDRTSFIPVPHLVAEIAAFPLTSEVALRQALTELDPDMKGSGGEFWRATERELLRSFPSTSIDEIVNLRDLLWFSTGRVPRSMAEHVQCMSSWFLRVEGVTARPALPIRALPNHRVSEASARWVWRWITLSMPPDLLLAAAPGACSRGVTLVSSSLAHVLEEKGYAQLHLHIGAAIQFPEQWVLCLLMLAQPNTRADYLKNPGGPLHDARDLAPCLVRAALIRTAMAWFLAWRPRPCDDFATFLEHSRHWRVSPTDAALLREVAGELANGIPSDPSSEYAAIRGLFARLSGVQERKHIAFLSTSRTSRATDHAAFGSELDIQALDPIGDAFPPCPGTTPEMAFVRSALEYMNSRDDKWFKRLFWQAVRIRCLYYRYVVQRPLTPGLQWFFRFYDRLRQSTLRPDAACRLLLAGRLEGADSGLASLEVRTAPALDLSNLLPDLCAHSDVRRARARAVTAQSAPLELGLVLHFVRQREGGAKQGLHKNRWRDTNADPARNQGHQRHADYYRMKRQEALAIARALCWFPQSLTYLRGIDTCTDELATPTWVLAPLFRYVRNASEKASQLLAEYQGAQVPPISLSAHAGEDWVHLLGALRRIDDTITFFRLGEGDRLGHALALGFDARMWALRAGHVAQAKEERLLDLAWEWSFYSRREATPPDNGRLVFLESDVARLSTDVFGMALSPQEVSTLWAALHTERTLRALGFPDGAQHSRGSPNWRPERGELLTGLLSSSRVFQRGRELEWIDASSDVEALRAVQRGLQAKVAGLSIVVEINPCSNLLIGDISDTTRHPVWNLAPAKSSTGGCSIPVCICSDDPMVFATTLPEEYQYMFDALMRRGFTEPEAMAWLDDVRDQGLRARFTLPAEQLRDARLFQILSDLPRLPP